MVFYGCATGPDDGGGPAIAQAEAEAALIYALLIRRSFGGLPGDKVMLGSAAAGRIIL